MYKINKQFAFEAAHHLNKVPDGHKCKRVHGHSYIVEVILCSRTLNEQGFVVDYTDLNCIKDYIDNVFDHRDLNEVLGGVEPTAENLANWLYLEFKTVLDAAKITNERTSPVWLHSVIVHETAKTWAMYSEE